jgi:hypothetical protein
MTKNMKMCGSSSTVIGLPFELLVQQRVVVVSLLFFRSGYLRSDVNNYGPDHKKLIMI